MATKQKPRISFLSDLVLKLQSFIFLLQFIVTVESIVYPFGIRTTCALKLMSQNEAQTLQG